MAYDRFLIAPFNTGLQTDLRPWLIPDEAFVELKNVYVFRGRVRKRFGSILMGSDQRFSRLRVQVGTIGAPVSPVPGTSGAIGQMFSAGAQLFTVWQANGAMLHTGVGTGTFNTATGVFALAGTGLGAGTPIFWYPALPVMGLPLYELGPINNQPLYAFDTRFAYLFSSGWARSTLGTTPMWHGTDNNFFWTSNWDGITPNVVTMFTSNFFAAIGAALVTDDPIWTFNSTTGWLPLSYSPDPVVNPTNIQPLTVTRTVQPATGTNPQIPANYVQTARIVLPFKDRLVLLNTIENNANGAVIGAHPITPVNYLTSTNTSYVNRARYSHNGSPFSTNAWLEKNQIYNPGGTGVVVGDGGGYVDAPTEEAIVSAEFIKDRLIVYFERSTWELAYTGNQILPFVWQKLNTELGSESQESSVAFDTEILTIGNTGVHACNGSNVRRIDTLIPDEIFKVRDKSLGVQRVYGIRDYFSEMVYWSFPSFNETIESVFPNSILAFNYKTGSWSFYDDCITAFGYFEQQSDTTWQTADSTWQEYDAAWNEGVVQAQFRQVVAGNQEGFTFLCIPSDQGSSRNAGVMQITNMTVLGGLVTITAINHTLAQDEFIAIENYTGFALTNVINQVYSIIDKDTFTIFDINAAGTYEGGGTIARVSRINLLSKQWNPYNKEGRDVNLFKIDFLVDNEDNGQVTVDYYPSSSNLGMISQGNPQTGTGAILGSLTVAGTQVPLSNVLELSPYPDFPLELDQDRLWHPVYFLGEGNVIQIQITLAPTQMTNTDIAWSDFQLHAMMLYTKPSNTRFQ